jgi:hypothetical protein
MSFYDIPCRFIGYALAVAGVCVMLVGLGLIAVGVLGAGSRVNTLDLGVVLLGLLVWGASGHLIIGMGWYLVREGRVRMSQDAQV